ncbi:hypothetical protein ALC57_08931, partial [Trachymyrmex cornetzi]
AVLRMLTPRRAEVGPEEIGDGPGDKGTSNATSGSVTPGGSYENGDNSKEFLSTGRTGRRNALPNILGRHAETGLSDLSDRFEELSTHTGNPDCLRPHVLQIILAKADRIQIYQAPRNSTADMPVRLRSGFCCRDTLSLPITNDDDDEGAMEACIVSVNKILEHSLTHLLTVTNAIEYIDSTTDTHKRRIEHNVLSCLLGNINRK